MVEGQSDPSKGEPSKRTALGSTRLSRVRLHKDMDAEIRLQTKDPNRPEVSVVVFGINGLDMSRMSPMR